MSAPFISRVTVLSALLVVAYSARAADTPQAPDGHALFLRHCGICHLPGGTGTFMLGRRLGEDRALLERRRDLSATLISTVVRHGLMNMPPFTRVELTDPELHAICMYLAAQSPGQDR